jgi:hypothetical protein
MAAQPLEIAFPINNFVDPRLQKQNRQKRGDKKLEQIPGNASFALHSGKLPRSRGKDRQ